jgi:GAF domain-containing protein
MADLDKPEEVVSLFQKAASFAKELMEENERLRGQVGKVEADTFKFAERYALMAEQSDLLQNLFVVTHRLHATLDPDEVLMTIKEIILNLLGSDRFSIWMLDENNSGQLNLLAQEGLSDDFKNLSPADLEMARSAIAGEAWFETNPNRDAASTKPMAMVPLKIGERPVGLIVIHGMLGHKKSLNANDQQVLELLSGQGAVALTTARLYSEKYR